MFMHGGWGGGGGGGVGGVYMYRIEQVCEDIHQVYRAEQPG